MADELRIGLAGLLRKAQMEHDADFLKEGFRVLSQALMEMGSRAPRSGKARAQPLSDRRQRNGYCERSWDTRQGRNCRAEGAEGEGLELLPLALLEPRRRKAERALLLAAVVQEACTCMASPLFA